jgi:hypothetical protein
MRSACGDWPSVGGISGAIDVATVLDVGEKT